MISGLLTDGPIQVVDAILHLGRVMPGGVAPTGQQRGGPRICLQGMLGLPPFGENRCTCAIDAPGHAISRRRRHHSMGSMSIALPWLGNHRQCAKGYTKLAPILIWRGSAAGAISCRQNHCMRRESALACLTLPALHALSVSLQPANPFDRCSSLAMGILGIEWPRALPSASMM